MSRKLDYEKPIPIAESVSVEYQRLRARQNELIDLDKALDAEVTTIKADIGQYSRGRMQADAVAALIEGVQFEAPVPLSQRLGEIEQQKRLIKAAQDEIAAKIQIEHPRASRLVAAEFEPERKALATEFFSHLAAAVRAHSQFGKIKDRLERAGVDSGSLHDFGREIAGSANSRQDHAAFAFRDAVKRGYIMKTDVPAGYL